MKKIEIKNKKRVLIISVIVLAIMLITSGIAIYATNKNKKENIETVQPDIDPPEEIIEEIEEDNSEISIEELTKEDNTLNKTNTAKTDSTNTYYIKINYGANVATIYTKDENGDYTVPIKAMVCSTGRDTPTSGTYAIKSRWRWLALLGGVYGQYSTQIVGNILFHSVPYLERGNPSSLEYWEYDKLRYESFCRMHKIKSM